MEQVSDFFLGAAEYYERYRVPYPQEAFDWIVNEYRLDGRGPCWTVAAVRGRSLCRSAVGSTMSLRSIPIRRCCISANVPHAKTASPMSAS